MTDMLDRAVAKAVIRVNGRAKKADLKTRYIAARRWHAHAVNAMDAIWLAGNAQASKAPPHERLAVWQALESDLAQYLAGVPEE
jgi:hypothetical protein